MWRVREILIGSYRGLLPIAPLVAVMPVGLGMLAASRHASRRRLVAAAIGVFYLVLNASYFYWEGGWAFGPRQVMPALPFLALGLAPLWDGWKAAGRVVLAGGVDLGRRGHARRGVDDAAAAGVDHAPSV